MDTQGRGRGAHWSTSVTPLLVVFVVVLVASAGVAGIAIAQDDNGDENPPEPPAAYYGEVTVDGEPAPAGLEVTAYVDGEKRGTITTDEGGTFGDSTIGGEKLTIDGTAEEVGEPVEFEVDGIPADTNVEWEPGDLQELDLSISTDDDGGYGGVPGGPSELPSDDIEPLVADVTGTETGAVLAVDEVGAGDRITADLGVGLGDGALTVRTIDVTLGSDVGSYELEIADRDPGTVDPQLDAATGLAGFDLSDTEDDDPVESVIIEFDLGDEALSPDESADDVTVYRLTETGWAPVSTVHTGDGALVARADGISTFVVAVPGTPINVVDASVGETAVEPGALIEVTATVANAGDSTATVVVPLTVDGEIVDERSITVATEDEQEIVFVVELSDPGAYDVTVGEVPAGTVTVGEVEEDDPADDVGDPADDADDSEADDDPDDDEQDIDDDGLPGFGIAIALFAVLTVALLRGRE